MQQCAHWKKFETNLKYAAMCPLEKKREKFEMRSDVPVGKKLTKIQNAQQCAHLKKKMRKFQNAKQCAQWKKIENN